MLINFFPEVSNTNSTYLHAAKEIGCIIEENKKMCVRFDLTSLRKTNISSFYVLDPEDAQESSRCQIHCGI